MTTPQKKSRQSYCFTESLPPNGKPGRPRGDWCTHQEAREWVRRQNFPSYKHWLRFAKERYTSGPLKGKLKRHRSIPANPQSTYAAEWISDSFFLGHVSYLSYQEVKDRVIPLNLKSYVQWIMWHKEIKPWWSPQQPDRVYDEWETWGKFLGTGNISIYDKQKLWRPFDEAVKYIHGYQLTTENEYVQWYKLNEPKDLPAHPDRVYGNDWQGWAYFLGKTVSDKMEAQHVDTRVFSITQHSGYPPNVFKIRIEQKGKSEILAKQRNEQFQIIKIYQYEEQYEQYIQQFLIRNIHELLFQLDSVLLWV
jgi:hypothetical protein